MAMILAARWVFAALWLVGCATTQAPVLGSSPQLVTVSLGSELSFRPYTADELALPVIRDSIARCERQKQPRCRDHIIGLEPRTTFTRSRDTTVVVLVTLKGL